MLYFKLNCFNAVLSWVRPTLRPIFPPNYNPDYYAGCYYRCSRNYKPGIASSFRIRRSWAYRFGSRWGLLRIFIFKSNLYCQLFIYVGNRIA